MRWFTSEGTVQNEKCVHVPMPRDTIWTGDAHRL